MSNPIRKVKGLYNNPEKEAQLYGLWQTIPWKYELKEDGSIPSNSYGNIELFNGPLPPTTCWLDVPKITLICKKL